MIKRYSRTPMNNIWALQNKFEKYLQVELAVCQAFNYLGQINDYDFNYIKTHAKFSIDRIEQIEQEVKHDVIAFLTCVNENINHNCSRFIHMGLTSSDVIDTALALQLKDANKIISQQLSYVINTIKNKALEHKYTICIGRSHGIIAEPMTFGIKLLTWLDIFQRAFDFFQFAKQQVEVGQISGPVGTFSNIDPQIETLTCQYLKLTPCKISTQVISRDRYSIYFQSLSNIANAIDFCCTEIRHLQRSEVNEVQEGFSKGQKGSSAMPHKKNPISSENLCGLSRIVKSNTIAAMQNTTLWHERDISHSSVERIIFPDTTILIDYMLNRFNNTVENLQVNKQRMLQNINNYGKIVYSQKVLLSLVKAGLSRENAYKIVQKNALNAFEQINGDFEQNLLHDKEICNILTSEQIKQCFDPNNYLNNIDNIFEKFFPNSNN